MHYKYLFSFKTVRLVLDPKYPDIDMDSFECMNWKQFYGEAKELLPGNAPMDIGT